MAKIRSEVAELVAGGQRGVIFQTRAMQMIVTLPWQGWKTIRLVSML